MSAVTYLNDRRERALRDALDKLDEIEARLLRPCRHVRGLAERSCIYCGTPLPAEYPTCASTNREIEDAFARLAPVVAALIERGERDD